MINALGIVFTIKFMKLEYQIKADGMMYIIVVDLDTTSKGKSSNCKGVSSTCKGKIISSSWNGKSIVDMPCPLVFCHPFLFTSISVPTLKNCWQLPSTAILSAVFFVHVPDIIIQPNKKTAWWNNIPIEFYVRKWTVDNVITNNMGTPCQRKCAACVYVLFISI